MFRSLNSTMETVSYQPSRVNNFIPKSIVWISKPTTSCRQNASPAGQTVRRNRRIERKEPSVFHRVCDDSNIEPVPSGVFLKFIARVRSTPLANGGILSRASFFWHNYELDLLSSLGRDASRGQGCPRAPLLFENISRFSSAPRRFRRWENESLESWRGNTTADPRQC